MRRIPSFLLDRFCNIVPYVSVVAVDGNDNEADKGYGERNVRCRNTSDGGERVDDKCLQRREYRTAKDGHNKAGTSELHIFAYSTKGNTVDGGEHQRHAARDSHQTVKTVAVGKQHHAN